MEIKYTNADEQEVIALLEYDPTNDNIDHGVCNIHYTVDGVEDNSMGYHSIDDMFADLKAEFVDANQK